jgi:hypothetical protein
MADNSEQIPSARDAALYYCLGFNAAAYVIGGAGTGLTCQASGLNVRLGIGEGVIYGHHVTEIDGTTSVNIVPGSSGFIAIRLDLSQPTGQEASLVATGTLATDNLLNGGAAFDLALYRYTSTSTAVTLTDVRNYGPWIPNNFIKNQMIESINAGKINIGTLSPDRIANYSIPDYKLAKRFAAGNGTSPSIPYGGKATITIATGLRTVNTIIPTITTELNGIMPSATCIYLQGTSQIRIYNDANNARTHGYSWIAVGT